jgi:hypothetical protein
MMAGSTIDLDEITAPEIFDPRGFWLYAAILEYLQHFSPGRHPSLLDFVASALGALCGGLPSPCSGVAPPISRPKCGQFNPGRTGRGIKAAHLHNQMVYGSRSSD